jgi:hypothetical protein
VARSLTSLVKAIATPFGTMIPNIGTTVYLSDEEFALVSPSSLGVAWTDNGQVSDVGDGVSTQAANVAAQGALTSAAPSAVGSAADGALTSSQNATTNASAPGVGYVQAEAASTATLANALKVSYNALQVDVAALRTAYNLAQTDVVNLRATLLATQADLATTRTKVNAALAALTGAGKPMST